MNKSAKVVLGRVLIAIGDSDLINVRFAPESGQTSRCLAKSALCQLRT